MAILKMSMDQVASLRRPGAKPLLQTGPYSVSEDLIRKAKSGSPDTPEFGSRTDPASNLQLTARCVYAIRSEEHTSELQSLMRTSYAVFCLKKKKNTPHTTHIRLKQQHTTYLPTTLSYPHPQP